ncbi:MAG: hypothetical protein OEV49_06145 [candidate division Zixibacteria bacterium]|nr:hypothetical protein [candidate division Zixibacteria bacterium]MDH3936377.1 hypothetical protein [candidate division Zixibacteria bacterium]MDH4032208.1 hypothetical protein [candidate division Zixibacteria bacterium]
MNDSSPKQVVIFLAHAIVAWGLCGAVMGVGLSVSTEETALIAHLVAAPFIAAGVWFVYFKKFAYTTPVQTAGLFIGCVITLDVLIVALLIEKSFDMFKSPIGTWIPFGLMFVAILLVGRVAGNSPRKDGFPHSRE